MAIFRFDSQKALQGSTRYCSISNGGYCKTTNFLTLRVQLACEQMPTSLEGMGHLFHRLGYNEYLHQFSWKIFPTQLENLLTLVTFKSPSAMKSKKMLRIASRTDLFTVFFNS